MEYFKQYGITKEEIKELEDVYNEGIINIF